MMIKLEAANVAHAELFLEYRQDPLTRQHNPLKPATLDEIRERLAKASSDWREFQTAESFMWFPSVEGRIVGTATLTVNRMMLTAEIGYGVFSTARGKGVGAAIVKELTRQAFESTSLRKLYAFVHDENEASIRILEKNGYLREGLLKQHYLIEGLPANELIFGLLRQEWALRN